MVIVITNVIIVILGENGTGFFFFSLSIYLIFRSFKNSIYPSILLSFTQQKPKSFYNKTEGLDKTVTDLISALLEREMLSSLCALSWISDLKM